MGANGGLGSPSSSESGLTDTASAVAELCPTLQLPPWLRGFTSAEHSLMILKELCQRKQELSGMPKEQLRTAILLATRDMLHDIVDETWVHLNKSAMRKDVFSGMSELAKIEYLRVLLQANVIDHMHELMRIRAEAEAISSLDNGSGSAETRRALLKRLLRALELLKRLFHDIMETIAATGNQPRNGDYVPGHGRKHADTYPFAHEGANGGSPFSQPHRRGGPGPGPPVHNVYSYPEFMRGSPQPYSLFDPNGLSQKSAPLPSPLNGWAGEAWGPGSGSSSALSSSNSTRSRASTFSSMANSSSLGTPAHRAFSDGHTSGASTGSPMNSVGDGYPMPMYNHADENENAFNMSQIAESLFIDDSFQRPFGGGYGVLPGPGPGPGPLPAGYGTSPRVSPDVDVEYEDECVALDAALNYLQRFLTSIPNEDASGQWVEPPIRYKTAMCKRIIDSSKCRYSKSCGFAHSEGEKDRFSRLHLATVKCQFGRKCRNPTCGRAHSPQAQQEAIRLYMGIVDKCRASKM